MNLERAPEQAHKIRSARAAARLFNSIEFELALGDPSRHLEAAGERALRILEQRFPGVQAAAREIEEPPSLSRRAGDELRSPRRRHRLAKLVVVLVAVGAGVALLARHVRRHPKHAVAAGVALLAVSTGRPSVLVTASVAAAMIAIVRRRPGALPRAPQPPRMPRPPRAPRLPR
jgi:hypothetical protein